MPQVVKTAAGRAVLLFDAVQQSVALVDGTTGKLRWRQPIDDGPPAPLTVIRAPIALVAGRSGSCATSISSRAKCAAMCRFRSPCAGARRRAARTTLLPGGAQANLYVLAAESGECREVFYLGHEAESITAPPLLVGRYIILAVNSGAEDSLLRILLADEEGLISRQSTGAAARPCLFDAGGQQPGAGRSAPIGTRCIRSTRATR